MKTIAIFFGGKSVEHDISIITGVQAFHAFDTSKYEPIPIYVSRDGIFYTGNKIKDIKNYKNLDSLIDNSRRVYIKNIKDKIYLCFDKILGIKKIQIDCAFLAFHGGEGENGGFQGFCETINLPYTGTDVLGSALCMDKISTKKILLNSDIPVTKYEVLTKNEFIKNKEESLRNIELKLSYPVFVKPSNGGSSIGVSRVKNKVELINALELAFSFDLKVLIEKEFIHDTEINISCLGNYNSEILFSQCEEVYSETEFLDFENKYLKGGKSKKITQQNGSKGMSSTNRLIPANISDQMQNQIKNYAEKAFRDLNCGGVVRIDFLVNKKDNSMVLVEINTIPGSLSFYLWEKTDLSFDKLINKLIELALERYNNKSKLFRTFNSSVLKNI